MVPLLQIHALILLDASQLNLDLPQLLLRVRQHDIKRSSDGHFLFRQILNSLSQPFPGLSHSLPSSSTLAVSPRLLFSPPLQLDPFPNCLDRPGQLRLLSHQLLLAGASAIITEHFLGRLMLGLQLLQIGVLLGKGDQQLRLRLDLTVDLYGQLAKQLIELSQRKHLLLPGGEALDVTQGSTYGRLELVLNQVQLDVQFSHLCLQLPQLLPVLLQQPPPALYQRPQCRNLRLFFTYPSLQLSHLGL